MPDHKRVKTGEQFLELLQLSNLLETNEVAKIRQLADHSDGPMALAKQLVGAGVLTRWQARQLLAGHCHLTLGNYRLCDEIGRSKSGGVFLAEHIQMQRQVAIKTMSRRLTKDQDYVARFLDETRRAATLDHHNILHIYDIDNQRERYFLVLEYIAGWDLQQLVEQQGPRSNPTSADYIRQALEGVTLIHRFGLLHRNLRPSNLMVDQRGTVKVLGLGTSHLDTDTAEQRDGHSEDQSSALGAFQAPEQATSSGLTDGRADIFSLGAIGLFLLTGQAPTSDSPDPSSVLADAPSDPINESGRSPGGRRELEAIFRQMMLQDPASRFQTAEEALQSLRNWIQSRHPGTPSVDVEKPPAIPAATEPTPTTTPLASEPDPSPASSPTNAKLAAAKSFDWAPTEPEVEPKKAPPPDGEPEKKPISRAQRVGRRRVVAGVALGLAVVATIVFAVWMHNYQPREEPRETARTPTAPPKVRDTLAPSQLAEPDNRTEPATPPSDPSDRDDPAAAKQPSQENGKAVEPEEGEPAAQTDPGDGPSDTASAPKSQEPAGTNKPLPKPNESGDDEAAPNKETTSAPPDTEPAAATDTPMVVEPPPPILAELPKAIALSPPTDEAAESTIQLGPLHTRPGVPLAVALLGGTKATDSDAEFTLEPSPSGGTQSWRIWMETKTEEKPSRQPVADLTVDDEQLTFAWTDDSVANPLAGHLINCALRISAAGEKHDLRLRQPVEVEPLVVNSKRPTFDGKWQVSFPPAADNLRWNITSMDEPLPSSFQLNSAAPLELSGKPILAKCGSDTENHPLVLEIKASMRRSLRLEGKILFQLPQMEKPEVATRRSLLATDQRVVRVQDRTNQQALFLSEQLRRVGRNDPRHAVLQRQHDAAQKQLTEATQTTDAWGEFTGLLGELGDGAAIHFRLFQLVDDCEIDLLITEPSGDSEENEGIEVDKPDD